MANGGPVYIVLWEDENKDTHMFSTRNLDRAEAMRIAMDKRYGEARANWLTEYLARAAPR